MNLINYFNRPEYIFRPSQIYRRLVRSPSRGKAQLPSKETNPFETVLLPWGVTIKIRPSPSEVVGRSLCAMGIYDLIVTEALWRLIDSGETAIDVGVNIGYMTTIMAKRVGETGKVLSFEPNPEVYEELSENIKLWQEDLGWHQIHAQKIALSNQSGLGVLSIPQANREEASLVSTTQVRNTQNNESHFKTYTVSLKTLDELLKSDESIGLIKIDVEGHELEVLQGATDLITKQKIRDIIFEEHRGYPSPVSQFLEEHGYTVFRLWKGFWKPVLKSPTQKRVHQWEPPSYLATIDRVRAIERFKNRGWNVLKNSKNKN
jgi:FkbM family methyltransferase